MSSAKELENDRKKKARYAPNIPEAQRPSVQDNYSVSQGGYETSVGKVADRVKLTKGGEAQ